MGLCARALSPFSPPAPPHQQRQQKRRGGEASSFLSFLLSAFCSPPCFSRKEKRHKTAMRKKTEGGGRKRLIRLLGRDFPLSFHGRMRAAVHFLSSLPPTHYCCAALPASFQWKERRERCVGCWGGRDGEGRRGGRGEDNKNALKFH